MGDNSEGSEVIVLIPSSLEAQKIEEPGGLQERPSYHMHLTLHLWVGAKRFSDVSTHACLHLILKLHAKNVLQTFLGILLRPQVYAIQVLSFESIFRRGSGPDRFPPDFTHETFRGFAHWWHVMHQTCTWCPLFAWWGYFSKATSSIIYVEFGVRAVCLWARYLCRTVHIAAHTGKQSSSLHVNVCQYCFSPELRRPHACPKVKIDPLPGSG